MEPLFLSPIFHIKAKRGSIPNQTVSMTVLAFLANKSTHKSLLRHHPFNPKYHKEERPKVFGNFAIK
jgi:hypothetical protein